MPLSCSSTAEGVAAGVPVAPGRGDCGATVGLLISSAAAGDGQRRQQDDERGRAEQGVTPHRCIHQSVLSRQARRLITAAT